MKFTLLKTLPVSGQNKSAEFIVLPNSGIHFKQTLSGQDYWDVTDYRNAKGADNIITIEPDSRFTMQASTPVDVLSNDAITVISQNGVTLVTSLSCKLVMETLLGIIGTGTSITTGQSIILVKNPDKDATRKLNQLTVNMTIQDLFTYLFS